MPSSVKLKLFYDTKEIVSTVNKVLEPSPSPLKEHINRKHRYKLQENHTKPKKWKPQPFGVSSARDRQTHEWWGVLSLCAVTKIPATLTTSGHILSQPTLFTTTDLAEQYMAHGVHNGFLLEKSAHEDLATLQSTLGNSSRRDIHSFVFFLPTL